MDIFEKIKQISGSDRNEYLDAALNSGRKAIGYFCSYVPEEIIHAAGFVPYRMRAVNSRGTAKGGIYYSSINCSFAKTCFGKALEGDFQFLDGIIFMNGCDHLRRMYDNWKYADVPPVFRHMFVTPHLVNDAALDRYRDELGGFVTAIENFYGIKITTDALRESIRLYNEKRSLLSALYQLRSAAVPPVKGSELLSIMLAVTMMPVSDAIDLLKQVLAAMPGRSVSRNGDLRIFLSSGCVEEREHIELIESCGAAVAADNLCLGSRHFDLNIDESEEPLDGIARRYLRHMSCPRMMDDFQTRLDYLQKSIKEYAVDAVIAEKLKFCDLWGGEMYLMKQESRKNNFPILLLERELYGSGEGQIRTRVQAFFEQVKNGIDSGSEMVRAAGKGYRTSDN
jgi:benzoyl-CoA reductase/2-hydroxyglutaryl-CoA dehydratase subunit BcrC/BadD/HgdB